MKLGSSSSSQIRFYRKMLRLSQSWVASQLGIKRTTYNQLELGKGSITLDHLMKLSGIFRTSLDSLVEPSKIGTVLYKVREIPFRLDVQTREADHEDEMEILRFFIQINEGPAEPAMLGKAENSYGIGSNVFDGIERCLKWTNDQNFLDIYLFIMKLGIELSWLGFSKLAGAYLRKGIRNGDEELRGYGIAVNSGHPIERQRFSAAHELGHHILGHKGKIGSYLKVSNEQMERDANIFAAELLMSKRLVSAAHESVFGNPDVRSKCKTDADAIYLMSKQLQVSFTAICHRLEYFRIINRSRKAEILKTKVRSLEQRWEKSGKKQSFDPAIVEDQHNMLSDMGTHYSCMNGKREYGPRGPEDLRLLQEQCYVAYILQNQGRPLLNSTEVFQKVTENVGTKFPIYEADIE